MRVISFNWPHNARPRTQFYFEDKFQSLNSLYPFFLRKRGIFQSCLGLWLQEKRNQYVGALPQMPFPLSVRQKRLWCLWWFDAQEYLSSVQPSPLSHPFSFWPGSQRVLPTPLPLIPLPSITKYYQVLPSITKYYQLLPLIPLLTWTLDPRYSIASSVLRACTSVDCCQN